MPNRRREIIVGNQVFSRKSATFGMAGIVQEILINNTVTYFRVKLGNEEVVLFRRKDISLKIPSRRTRGQVQAMQMAPQIDNSGSSSDSNGEQKMDISNHNDSETDDEIPVMQPM